MMMFGIHAAKNGSILPLRPNAAAADVIKKVHEEREDRHCDAERPPAFAETHCERNREDDADEGSERPRELVGEIDLQAAQRRAADTLRLQRLDLRGEILARHRPRIGVLRAHELRGGLRQRKPDQDLLDVLLAGHEAVGVIARVDHVVQRESAFLARRRRLGLQRFSQDAVASGLKICTPCIVLLSGSTCLT